MILFYLVFLAITLSIGYFLFRYGEKTVSRFRAGVHVSTLLGGLFLVMQVLVWLYLTYVCLNAIFIEFTNKPKPYFLITWFLGLVVYGFLSMLREPLDMFLDRRARDADQKTD